MKATKKASKLVPFDAARYLNDEAAIAEYMTVVLEAEGREGIWARKREPVQSAYSWSEAAIRHGRKGGQSIRSKADSRADQPLKANQPLEPA